MLCSNADEPNNSTIYLQPEVKKKIKIKYSGAQQS